MFTPGAGAPHAAGFHPAAPQPQPPQPQPQPGMYAPAGAPPGGAPAGRGPAPPGMAGGVPGGGAPAPDVFQEHVDYSIQVPASVLRLTSRFVPAAASLGHQCKVPLGAVVRPLAPPAPGEDDVQVVQPGAAGIVRCKRCVSARPTARLEN